MTERAQDHATRDGQPVFDVNKTPNWGKDVRPDVVTHLRRGIDHLLAG